MNFKIKKLKKEYFEIAQKHIDFLTKPQGSLGKIETVAKRLFAIFQGNMPEKLNKRVYVFAGDHGIAKIGVSAFPQDVTRQMVYNFLRGGAAINVFSAHNDVDVRVVDTGVDYDFEENLELIDMKVGRGTKNIVVEPAMSLKDCEKCINNGRKLAEISKKDGINLLASGDMGIGNTTPSSVLFSKYLGLDAKDVVGKGTGISDEKILFKLDTVKKTLDRIKDIKDPLEILANAGGFEIAHIAGLAIGSAEQGIPYVVDGFISTAGALAAINICPEIGEYLFFAHISAEANYKKILNSMGYFALLDLDLRLGEGTGAVLAMNLIEAGLKMYNNMATFEGAGVSDTIDK